MINEIYDKVNELQLTSQRARARAEVRAVSDVVIQRWAEGIQYDESEYSVDDVREDLIKRIDSGDMELIDMILKTNDQ